MTLLAQNTCRVAVRRTGAVCTVLNESLGETTAIPLPGDAPRVRLRYGSVVAVFARGPRQRLNSTRTPHGSATPRWKLNTAAGFWKSQYWFRVPARFREFWVEVYPDSGYYSFGSLGRVTLWDPRGQGRTSGGVPERQEGRLWRLSLPGGHAGFRLDPRVPHVFAASPDRFFLPESR